jgi:hypothetical protein
MGSLFKFVGFPFEDAAAEDEGKSLLKQSIESVRSKHDWRQSSCCRNVEMLTLAGEGLPIRRHFDWTVGLNPDGNVVLFGNPCSDRDVEQRAKVSDCLDFFNP